MAKAAWPGGCSGIVAIAVALSIAVGLRNTESPGRVAAAVCAEPSFLAPGVFPVGPLPLAVAVGDFNGDGVLDLAVAAPRRA